jgi:nicotinamide phosphoribosyltransferase
MRNVLHRFPTGTVACVSDSYDVFRACAEVGEASCAAGARRDGNSGGAADSGSSLRGGVEVSASPGAQRKRQGYRILDPHVRVIRATVDRETCTRCSGDEASRPSADNVAFGCGGGLPAPPPRYLRLRLQVLVDRRRRDRARRLEGPCADPGKRSKAGRLALVRRGETLSRTDARVESAGTARRGLPRRRDPPRLDVREVRERAAQGL